MQNITTTNNRIIFIVSYTYFDEQYEDMVGSVVRYSEQNFNLSQIGENGQYSASFNLNSSWEYDQLHIVVLVQSFTGIKTIHQAYRRRLDAYEPQLASPRRLLGEFHDSPDYAILQWEIPLYDNTELIGYEIYRDGELIFYNDTDPEALSFIDYDIIPETMYYYWVQAVYTHGTSKPSRIVDIYTDNSVPKPVLGVPDNFKGYDQMADDHKFLIWNLPNYENTEFLEYNLYRNNVVIATISNVYEVYYNDRNIIEQGDLVYYVTATYTHGVSKPSNTYITKVLDITDNYDTANDFSNNYLLQNYPNPFNPSTNISFVLNHDSNVKLAIYNIKGQHIDTLIDDYLFAGKYNFHWMPVNLTSGVYFYKLDTNHNSIINKMILMK